jgi:hypothetical protein
LAAIEPTEAGLVLREHGPGASVREIEFRRLSHSRRSKKMRRPAA